MTLDVAWLQACSCFVASFLRAAMGLFLAHRHSEALLLLWDGLDGGVKIFDSLPT